MQSFVQKVKQKADMVTVGGIISLVALIVFVVCAAYVQFSCDINNYKGCGFFFMLYSSITVPLFILGLIISIISYIARATKRNHIRITNPPSVKKTSILASIRVAFAIIFGIFGISAIIIALIIILGSSSYNNAVTPALCGLMFSFFSVSLFAIRSR